MCYSGVADQTVIGLFQTSRHSVAGAFSWGKWGWGGKGGMCTKEAAWRAQQSFSAAHTPLDVNVQVWQSTA